jgi:ribosomal protein S18 acetylase RimI-like enzyme
MTIEVREATPGEYDAAGRVTADSYREFVRENDDDWRSYLDRIADVAGRADRTAIMVAVEEGRLLGSATLELDGRTEPESEPVPPGEAHIRMLGVAPDARRRGVARLLMAACEDRARAAGRTRMTLNTTQRMEAAQRMYASLGYEREPDRVFPDGFVLLSYAKRL